MSDKHGRAYWTGGVVLFFGALAQLLFITADLFLTLTIVTLDVLLIAGLIEYVATSAETAARGPSTELGIDVGGGPRNVVDPSAGPVESEGGSIQWLAWRRAAQTVTRAWHEWSAATAPDRAYLYQRYAAAVAAEERAAADLEQIVKLAAGAPVRVATEPLDCPRPTRSG